MRVLDGLEEMKGRCLVCNTHIGFTGIDLHFTILNNVYVKCPYCKSKLYLSDEQLLEFGIRRVE